MAQYQRIVHPLEPVFNRHSKILILGTMPSPKSREVGFYYGHPQNRFWRVLAALFGCDLPRDNDARTELLLREHIALWDVLACCDIVAADDGSIRNPVVNDLNRVLLAADIRNIYTTGAKAYHLYQKHCRPTTARDAVALPSTSPANCRYYTFDALVQKYQVIKNDLR